MARQDELKALRDQVTDLQNKLARALGEDIIVSEDEIPPEQRGDYIEFGSDAHAALLGLKRVNGDYEGPYQIDGWTLLDTATPLLASRGSKEYVVELLRQKVSSLESGAPPLPQSDDPRAPNYAPPLWEPSPMDR